jgi:hypothetical protein
VVFFDGQLAFEIFFLCQTQWTYSMEGITGLNYSSVIDVIALYEKRKSHQLALLKEVSAIESGYLRAFNEMMKERRA